MRARDRAGEAFDAFLNERGAKPLGPDVAARLVAAGSQALLAGDLLVVVATDLGYRAMSCPEGAATVDAQVRSLLAGVDHLADAAGWGAPGSRQPRASVGGGAAFCRGGVHAPVGER